MSESKGPRAAGHWPRYRIGQVSRKLGVEPSTLRYWEEVFPQLCPARRRGQRLYSERDLDLLTCIRRLLYERGYTIRGAREALVAEAQAAPAGASGLPGGDSAPVPASELLEAAQRELGAIVERLRRPSVRPSGGPQGGTTGSQ
jgi:DNA-binding transcriptional MerR regulator